MKKVLLLACCMLLLAGITQAQVSTDTAALFKEMRQVYEASRQAPIAYDVKTYFTDTTGPAGIPDSMFSHVELNGDNMRVTNEVTETVYNDKYQLVLFKEEKRMMIARRNREQASPLDMMNGQLLAKVAGSWSKASVKGKEIITITGKESSPVKQIIITLDHKTGHMEGILLELRQAEDAGHPTYMTIRYAFSNYTALPAGYNGTDERRYFVAGEKEYRTAAAYADYQIFLASPNL
ncbi:hypothetical protein [Chitinophaga vietnamensis]|uniref:hypothetical protein n=1 Tax=Chitinophaga vietnamensis TaxID=2593957 RepID=UPI001177AF1B|nr:hypothetical protein [Chitinophaga vietnamensis]